MRMHFRIHYEENAIKNVLIVGAGPGLSLANARKFGAHGSTVHLIGRSIGRMNTIADELRGEDIDVRLHEGDATRHAEITELIRVIDSESHIDVCIYQPGVDDKQLVDALDVTVENMRPNVELLMLGAVAVAEALLPAMVRRGNGSLVFVGGGSARLTLRAFGNLGPASAGLRNFALTISGALEGTGVHASFLTIAGMIGSDSSSGPELSPAVLADSVFKLAHDRDTAEVIMTSEGEAIPRGRK